MNPCWWGGRTYDAPVDILYDWPLPLLLLLIAGLLLLTAFWGQHVGRRHRDTYSDEARDYVKIVTGVVLSLMTLLLSFSLSSAIDRYEKRRDTLVLEANAIRTAYLQATLLPQPRRAQMTDLLKQYVDVRDRLYAAGSNELKLNEAVAQSDDIHLKLWAVQRAQAAADPDGLPTRQVSETLTAMIDENAHRLSQLSHRLPTPLFLLLILVGTVAAFMTGFGRGLTVHGHSRTQVVLLLLIAVVVTAILDSDRPRDGLIVVPDDAMKSVEFLMERLER